ncbi:hypothetical protein LZ633_20625 [Enterobacter asburiae]|nr:hypothetical protein [Enterobacter asburiae]
MKNSNGIRAALQIITRVSELVNAGLKLKDQKTTLRRVLLELANEAPAEILEAVHVALRSPSNVIRTMFDDLLCLSSCNLKHCSTN